MDKNVEEVPPLPLRSNHPETLAWEPLDSEHILACERTSYLRVREDFIKCNKDKWFKEFQKRPFACCKQAAHVEVEAWYSNAQAAETGDPDLYKFYCRVCEEDFNLGVIRPGRNKVAGYCAAVLCCGGNHPLAKKFSFEERPELYDLRPMWEVR